MLQQTYLKLKSMLLIVLAAVYLSIFPIGYTFTQVPVPDKGIIYLNFNGYTAPDSSYTYNRITWSPSNLVTVQKMLLVSEVSKYFAKWEVFVTSNRKDFDKYPTSHRAQIVISPDTLYSNDTRPGGLSYINSLLFQDTTPAIVSESAFQYYPNMAQAIAHETGHMLGLVHQSLWLGSSKFDEYNPGDMNTAPIMGRSYFALKAVWSIGLNSYGLLQDDEFIISKTFKLRFKQNN